MNYFRYLLIFLLLECSGLANAQVVSTGNIRIQVGVSVNFGTHVNRVGGVVGVYYVEDAWQANLNFRYYYHYKNLGPPLAHSEFQIDAGILGAFGVKNNRENSFFHPLSNQTGRKYSFGYVQKWYITTIESSQRSGAFSIGLGNFEIIHENDFLAYGVKDRFRTSGFSINYVIDDFRLSINNILWTGDSQGEKMKRIMKPENYDCRFGYKDLTETTYGKFSHGILSIGAQYHVGLGQVIGLESGVDAEQIRHVVQNKFIHDFPLVPRSWEFFQNPHYPMLDKNGEPVVNMKIQKVRPLKYFFRASLNPTIFY